MKPMLSVPQIAWADLFGELPLPNLIVLLARQMMLGLATISSWTVTLGDGAVHSVSGNVSTVTHVYSDGPATFTISAQATIFFSVSAKIAVCVVTWELAQTVIL